MRQSVEQYKQDGRGYLQVAFGCTGGQHRSVYFAEKWQNACRILKMLILRLIIALSIIGKLSTIKSSNV